MPENRENSAPELPDEPPVHPNAGQEESAPSSPSQEPSPEIPPETSPSAQEQKATRQQQSRQRGYVFQYIAILFAAAFILLFFTYIMERRQYEQRKQQDQEQIESLNRESISAVQSIKDLYAENEALANRVEELEGLLEQAQSSAAGAAREADDTEKTLERTCTAMDWFWQLDEAYVRDRYTLCREIIATMEENPADPLVNYLSRESATDNRRFSPYDRYMEIREAVM